MSVILCRGTRPAGGGFWADGPKVVLPRERPETFWDRLRGYYVDGDARRWRALAMLALAENAGWPPDRIAPAFDTTPKTVVRSLAHTKAILRRRFRPGPAPDAAASAADGGGNDDDARREPRRGCPPEYHARRRRERGRAREAARHSRRTDPRRDR